MTKFLCGECIHNSDKGGGCLIPKNLGYVDNCNHYLPKDRPIVQTNEEYLRSCDTEQLAEWIASVVQKAISIKENNGIVMLESAIWWEEWLKQQHTKGVAG